MVLEALPWRTFQHDDGGEVAVAQLGSMLVSLTSCSVVYQDPISPELSTWYQLPIEPVPSTFVLNFDAGSVGSKEGSRQRNLSELNVEFDFGTATRIVEELLLNQDESTGQADSTSATMEAGDGTTELPDDPSMAPLTCDLQREGRGNITTDGAGSPPMDLQKLMSTIRDYEDRKLLLKEIQARMDQDARSLDMTLRVLGCIGIVLFGVLIWAIYHFYRSSAKSDKQTQDIQDSMKKTRRVLRDAVDGLQPQILEKRFIEAEHNQQQSSTPKASNLTRAMALDEDLSLPFIQPSMLAVSEDMKTVKKREPFFSVGQDPYPCGSVSSSYGYHPRTVEIPEDAPHTPQRDGAQTYDPIAHPPREPGSPSSPYTAEKFEREWMEKVTLRQSNRKKKRTPLRPIPLPTGTMSRTKTGQTATHIVGPPQLLSVVRDNGNALRGISTPDLCSTPASEDHDAAVDEYVRELWGW